MSYVRAKERSLARGTLTAFAIGLLVVGCGKGGDDGQKVKTAKGAKTTGSGGAKASSSWQPTVEDVQVSNGHVSVQLEGCGKNCSVVSEPKPTKFEYGQTSTKMWRSARFPIPDSFGPGKNTLKVQLKDTSFGNATVEIKFDLKKAYFDGTSCKFAKCKYEHALNAVTVFAPKGTKVNLGSAEKTVAKDEKASSPYTHSAVFPIDGMKNFKAFEAGDKSAGDKKEPLVLTLPDGQVIKTMAYVAWRGDFFRWLSERLKKAKPGTGVRIPGESKRAPARPRSIKVFPGGKLVGGKNVDRPSMVDEVAFFKKRQSKQSCGTYVTKWKTRYSSFMYFDDWVVDVYDRRSGRKKLSKVLKSTRNKCPKKVAAPPQGQTKVVVSTSPLPDQRVIFDFLSKRLAK